MQVRDALYSQEVVRAPLAYLILQHLSIVGRCTGPKEIANSIDRNPGSVRSRLSKMVSQGLVSKPYYGKYELTSTHGLQVSRGGLRVQNLVVVASGVPVRQPSAARRRELKRGEASYEVDVDLELLTIHITFGAFRGRISYRVGVPLGLDPVGLELVHRIVHDLVAAEGYTVPEEAWIVENVEFLEDFRGFRLEGMKSVTFWNMLGEMVKYYSRPALRREVRLPSTRGVHIAEIRTLWNEGVDAAQVHRRMDRVERELEGVKVAQKRSNENQGRIIRLGQALLDAFIRTREAT